MKINQLKTNVITNCLERKLKFMKIDWSKSKFDKISGMFFVIHHRTCFFYFFISLLIEAYDEWHQKQGKPIKWTDIVWKNFDCIGRPMYELRRWKSYFQQLRHRIGQLVASSPRNQRRKPSWQWWLDEGEKEILTNLLLLVCFYYLFKKSDKKLHHC